MNIIWARLASFLMILHLLCFAGSAYAGDEEGESSRFLDLPTEVQLAIMQWLDPASFSAISQTCRELNKTASFLSSQIPSLKKHFQGDGYGYEPLEKAIQEGSFEAFRYFYDKYNASRPKFFDRSPSNLGHWLTVLAKMGTTESKYSPGQLKIARYLIKKGADVNIEDPGSPLYWAATNNNIELAALLLKKGAKPYLSGNRLASPLYQSIKNDSIPMAKLLLEYGANIKQTDSKGNRPLHWATGNPTSAMYDFLLGKGADFCALNKKGESAPFLAGYTYEDHPDGWDLGQIERHQHIVFSRTAKCTLF